MRSTPEPHVLLLEKVGGKIADVGETLTTHVTVPVLAAGTAAVKTASDFDTAMSKVAAVSGATGDELQDLRDKAREMGAKTKFSASEAAEAILNLQQYKHRHDNQAVLDHITKAMISAMEEYGPFEDWTREQIHTLFESVNNFSNTAHTHENKAVLDSITEQYIRDLTAFQASTANVLHGLTTGLSEVSAQAHSHANKAILDSITQEMLDDIASISTVVG